MLTIIEGVKYEEETKKKLFCGRESCNLEATLAGTEILAKEYLKNNIIPERYFIDVLNKVELQL